MTDTRTPGGAVPARVSLVTLGVADLARSTAFYLALGWPLSSASVEGEVSFFRTAAGCWRCGATADLAADAGAAPATARGFRGVSLAVNVESRDRGRRRARRPWWPPAAGDQAGGEDRLGRLLGILRRPRRSPWEVAHNPFWPIGPDGRPQLKP